MDYNKNNSNSLFYEFYKIFYIRVYGRPFELHNIISKNNSNSMSFIDNREQSNLYLKAYHIYNGSLYISSFLSFILFLKLSKFMSFKKNIIINSKYILLSFCPLVSTYLYLTISGNYYYYLRPVLLSQREKRNKFIDNINTTKNFEGNSKYLIDSYKEFDYITSNLSIFACMKQALKHYIDSIRKFTF